LNIYRRNIYRRNISSGAKWKELIGYSRAVVYGNSVELSGTTAVVNGALAHPGDAYLPATTIIEIVGKALQEAGSDFSTFVRTRTHDKSISEWERLKKAHAEALHDVMSATALMEVSGIVGPEMLVEIEYTAYLSVE